MQLCHIALFSVTNAYHGPHDMGNMQRLQLPVVVVEAVLAPAGTRLRTSIKAIMVHCPPSCGTDSPTTALPCTVRLAASALLRTATTRPYTARVASAAARPAAAALCVNVLSTAD